MTKALYRKWRPLTFDDVYGQEHITTTLKNEIKSQKFSHAYLFTGSRGTGKTSCSKILAKSINCLNSHNGNPCLQCENCIKIANDETLDVIEIDAASNNGVDNIRQLREEALYTPSVCKYRVYIIDETHMLSQGAFNALLKIMEEPPAHVVFILATTEVHKVPATILSRCQRFDFKRIEPETISQRLEYIAKKENFKIEKDACLTIAKISDGGMRDAISLLDQCWSISDNIDINLVRKVAAITGNDYVYSLVQAIVDKNISEAIKIINDLYSDSKNLEQLCVQLIEFFRNVMIFKAAGTLNGISNLMLDETVEIEKYSSLFKMSKVLQIIATFQDCKTRQVKVSNKRLEIEMCFIKLCYDKLDSSLSGIITRLDEIERQFLSTKNVIVNNTTKNNIINENQFPENSKEVIKNTEEENILYQSQQSKEVIKKDEEHSVENNLSNGEIVAWQEILLNIKKINQPLFGIIMNSTAVFENNTILIKTQGNVMLEKILSQEMQRKSVEKAILQTLGQSYPIRLENTIQENKKAPVLDRFLNHAKQAGVEIEEE